MDTFFLGSMLMKKTGYTQYFNPKRCLGLITNFLGRFWYSTQRIERMPTTNYSWFWWLWIITFMRLFLGWLFYLTKPPHMDSTTISRMDGQNPYQGCYHWQRPCHAWCNLIIIAKLVHHLCLWHLSSNASTNLPIREFKIQFSKLMYNYYTEEEFDEWWADLVETNQLHNNVWVSLIYKKKNFGRIRF